MTETCSLPERVADAILHGCGVIATVAASAVLLTLAIQSGEPRGVAAAAVYAGGLLASFGFSAAYNLCPASRWKEALRRCDHAAIYLFIAATYTPLCLVALRGETGVALLVAVWAVALLGFGMKLAWPRRFERVSIALYLALGWAGLAAAGAIVRALPTAALVLLLVGGILYSLGVVFHVWRRLRFQNAIWHGFVLSAAACHYAAVVATVVR